MERDINKNVIHLIVNNIGTYVSFKSLFCFDSFNMITVKSRVLILFRKSTFCQKDKDWKSPS